MSDQPMFTEDGEPVDGLPEKPYGRKGSGWSGTDTSAAAEPLRAGRQREVLALIRHQGTTGGTWRDVSTALALHHGTASGCLSTLHKAGRLARLAERRGRCKVYVVPEAVGGRATEPHGGNTRALALRVLREFADTDQCPPDVRDAILTFPDPDAKPGKQNVVH